MALTSDKRIMAVGRSNNSIEICDTETFSQLLVIPGHKNVDIRNITWIEKDLVKGGKQKQLVNPFYHRVIKNGKVIEKKRRLVTTSLNGLVVEWDLLTGGFKSKTALGGGAIWCSRFDGKFGYLACEDGAIRVIKVKKKRIELVKQLSKADSGCLSIDIVK